MIHLITITCLSVASAVCLAKLPYIVPYGWFAFISEFFSWCTIVICSSLLVLEIFADNNLEKPVTLYVLLLPIMMNLSIVLLLNYKKIAFLQTQSIFRNRWNYIITLVITVALWRVNQDGPAGRFIFAYVYLFLAVSYITSYINYIRIILTCRTYKKQYLEGYSKIHRSRRYGPRKVFVTGTKELPSLNVSRADLSKEIVKGKYLAYGKNTVLVIFCEDVYHSGEM